MLNLLLLCGAIIFVLVKYVYSYWKRNGVPEIAPHIPFGCMMPFVKKEMTAAMAIAKTYTESNEPFVGIYVFFVPELLIRDLELIRKIMIEDFDSFVDHDNYINEEFDPFSVNLFTQVGAKWKRMRQRMTPLFTLAKLKSMFPFILKEAENLDEYLEKMARKGEPVDLRNSFLSYILNVAASIFLGINVDTINEPNHDFKKIFEMVNHCTNIKENLRQFSIFFFPKILKTFNIHGHQAEVRNYFVNIVRSTIEYRTKENISRNDMLQVLMELREKEGDLSIETIAGSLFIFFHASSEASTGLGVYSLYELGKQPELLKKAQSEVRQNILRSNREFTYEAVTEIDYLDLVTKETLRKYTPLAVNNRLATKDYHIPEHKFTIKKGTPVLLPVSALHKNEKYFPKPMLYIPERFEKGSQMADEKAFIPFGAGPKVCPAWKLGYLMSKLVMAKILNKYDLELLTQEDLKVDPYSLTGLPKDPIMIKLSLKDD